MTLWSRDFISSRASPSANNLIFYLFLLADYIWRCLLPFTTHFDRFMTVAFTALHLPSSYFCCKTRIKKLCALGELFSELSSKLFPRDDWALSYSSLPKTRNDKFTEKSLPRGRNAFYCFVRTKSSNEKEAIELKERQKNNYDCTQTALLHTALWSAAGEQYRKLQWSKRER